MHTTQLHQQTHPRRQIPRRLLVADDPGSNANRAEVDEASTTPTCTSDCAMHGTVFPTKRHVHQSARAHRTASPVWGAYDERDAADLDGQSGMYAFPNGKMRHYILEYEAVCLTTLVLETGRSGRFREHVPLFKVGKRRKAQPRLLGSAHSPLHELTSYEALLSSGRVI